MSESLHITALGNGRFEIADGSERRMAFAARSGTDTWVFLDGRVHVISSAPAGRSRAHRDDASALAAPMPATVAAVNIAPGQQVARGGLLISL